MSRSPGSKDSSGKRRVNLIPGAGGLHDSGSKDKDSGLPEQVEVLQESHLAEVPCDLCKKPTRIYTTSGRLMSGCDSCKRYIEIGRGAITQAMAPEGRGMRKEMRVEPDWGLTLDDDADYESFVAPGYELED